MKSKMLKIVGLLAFAALMVMNIQLLDTGNESGISLNRLMTTANAQSGGGEDLPPPECCPQDETKPNPAPMMGFDGCPRVGGGC